MWSRVLRPLRAARLVSPGHVFLERVGVSVLPVAERAFVREDAEVDAAVAVQVLRVAEARPTVRALVRLLACETKQEHSSVLTHTSAGGTNFDTD